MHHWRSCTQTLPEQPLTPCLSTKVDLAPVNPPTLNVVSHSRVQAPALGRDKGPVLSLKPRWSSSSTRLLSRQGGSTRLCPISFS